VGNIDRYPTYKGGKVTEVVVYANYIGLCRFYRYVVNISRWSPYEGGQLDRFYCNNFISWLLGCLLLEPTVLLIKVFNHLYNGFTEDSCIYIAANHIEKVPAAETGMSYKVFYIYGSDSSVIALKKKNLKSVTCNYNKSVHY